MRILLIAALAVGTFMVSMVGSSNDAKAVVVVGRPAVVHPRAVVVAPRHGAVCRRYGVVGGVRRCVLY